MKGDSKDIYYVTLFDNQKYAPIRLLEKGEGNCSDI